AHGSSGLLAPFAAFAAFTTLTTLTAFAAFAAFAALSELIRLDGLMSTELAAFGMRRRDGQRRSRQSSDAGTAKSCPKLECP
ncbi:MAG TPA: hypothetical protein VIB38_07965, partial [Aestuariivirgaceae bacterium]